MAQMRIAAAFRSSALCGGWSRVRLHRVVRRALTLAAVVAGASTSAAQPTVKVAYFNIQSGKGEPGLPGRPIAFADTNNCSDVNQPLNAWGTGFIQAELTRVLADPSVIALGLTESWASVCGSPENVRRALGWRARSSERNGVAMVARHGFAGPEQWLQLDTSLNVNPADTMWVLRLPVCLDLACAASIPVYVAHWYSGLAMGQSVFDRQAEQTANFLTATGSSEPHIFGGDLNVWEGATEVCSQMPNNTSLGYLRRAGYMDAWVTVHGAAEGFTGMTNRPGCGTPEGYAWKRIDYVWSPPGYLPLDIQRFGVVAPGEAAPSDHYGVVATFPYPEAGHTDDVVLYARRATTLSGSWRIIDDVTAAGSARIGQPDAAASKLLSPLAAPVDYFELTFTPAAGRLYHLWIRGKAQNNSWANDSVFVQFSGSVTASGAATYRIGTTSAVTVNLEEASSVGLSGWGWQDNGYGTDVLGAPILFDGTPQRLRVQTREDGFSIDQIVLSAGRYVSTSPGALKNDTTILPETTATLLDLAEVVVRSSAGGRMAGTFRTFADDTAAEATAIGTLDAGLPKVISPAITPESYVELSFQAQAGTPYRLWLRGRAERDSWANDSVYVQFSQSVKETGTPIYRIGTSSALTVNLEDAANAGISGWGWQDTGYGLGVLGPLIYFATDGLQVMRVQVREDGYRFDQIVLSSQRYFTAAPGALKNDTTILP